MTRLTPVPAGPPTANTNGQALPTTVAGTYSFAVTLADGAGHTATLTHTYTVGGAPSISGKLVFTRNNRIWSINPDGSGLAQLTGTSGDPGTWLRRPARQVAGRHEGRLRAAQHGGRSCPALGDRLRRVQPAAAHLRHRRQHRAGVVAGRPEDRLPVQPHRLRTGSTSGSGSWNPSLPTPLFNLVNLTNAAGDDLTPAWSPASVGKIAFASNRNGKFDIFTMPKIGGAPLALTSDKATDREPSWSPDGTKITFSSNRATSSTTFGYEIYVMGAPNGNSQNRITTIAGDDKAPFWLDANRIVFSSAQVAPTPPAARSAALRSSRRRAARRRRSPPPSRPTPTPADVRPRRRHRVGGEVTPHHRGTVEKHVRGDT